MSRTGKGVMPWFEPEEGDEDELHRYEENNPVSVI